MNTVLGRTNRTYPRVWLRLAGGGELSQEDWTTSLAEAAANADTVLDISAIPALWGGLLRRRDCKLMAVGSADWQRADSHDGAFHAIQGDLISLLSCVGREHLDFYFLRVSHATEESVISGVLQALELSRQEGTIGILGIFADGPAIAVQSVWQFHDAFDVALIGQGEFEQARYQTLTRFAASRRVGVVGCRALDLGGGLRISELPNVAESDIQAVISAASKTHPTVVEVRSPAEVANALAGALNDANEEHVSVVARLAPESTWEQFQHSDSARLQKAYALRREQKRI